MLLRSKRRFLAPEVIQTSAMDCGPAALQCLLNGFGISTSFARLREACQTNVDGTSIDALEDLARQLGLDADQIMLPADHLLLAAAQLLPAIAVVRRPNHLTHFIVIWRCHGSWVQVMDPATGRRWLPFRRLLEELYTHSQRITATSWRQWAGSADFLDLLQQRMEKLGISSRERTMMVQAALADSSWQPLARLDAATRMVQSLEDSGAVRRGREAGQLLSGIIEQCGQDKAQTLPLIPHCYWSALPDPHGECKEEPELVCKGIVLVSASASRQTKASATQDPLHNVSDSAAALQESLIPFWKRLFQLLLVDSRIGLAGIFSAIVLAAAGVLVEALLLRSLFELSRQFVLVEHRVLAMGAVISFIALMLGLDWGIARGGLRLGRRLEARLRIAFLEKLPRLGDRYFHSRLLSDMAQRLHTSYSLRYLPQLGGQWLRTFFELAFTVAGIAWLDPSLASKAVVAAALALLLPWLLQPWLVECDMRLRVHSSALSRYYLDAMAGLIAIGAHSAQRVLRREHDHLLGEWIKAGAAGARISLAAQGLQSVLGCGLAALLLFSSTTSRYDPSNLLLLVYWILNLPYLANDLAASAEMYAAHRNIALRLMEPLGAPEEHEAAKSTAIARGNPAEPSPCSIRFEQVWVRAGGQTILKELRLEIAAGSHVAIVGPSGAGKSSLLGLLLGWHRPVQGQILVDGQRLEGPQLTQLRAETAWVDPSVQLWNQSFVNNLIYGIPPDQAGKLPLPKALETMRLHPILQKLPDGLQTPIGEGGGMLSGGEGQLVRLARAWLRPEVRLVLLDEPFHGLDRPQRDHLLSAFRQECRHLTFLCVLHDLEATRQFDRVLVLDHGEVVEDGTPSELLRTAGSRYQNMLEAEKHLRQTLWSSQRWQQARIQEGQWVESFPGEAPS